VPVHGASVADASDTDLLKIMVYLKDDSVLADAQPQGPGTVSLASQRPQVEARIPRRLRQSCQNLTQPIGNRLWQSINFLLSNWMRQQRVGHNSPQGLHGTAIIQEILHFPQKGGLRIRLRLSQGPADKLVERFAWPPGLLQKLLRVAMDLQRRRLYHHGSNSSHDYLSLCTKPSRPTHTATKRLHLRRRTTHSAVFPANGPTAGSPCPRDQARHTLVRLGDFSLWTGSC
jgi:hypothetical protein